MKSMLFLALVLVASSSALPKQKITSAKKYHDALTKGLGCDLCVTLVTEIDEILVSQPTLDAAIEAIGGLCDILPEIVTGVCHSFIETYLPQVIEYLVDHQLEPHAVCEAIALCEAAPKKH